MAWYLDRLTLNFHFSLNLRITFLFSLRGQLPFVHFFLLATSVSIIWGWTVGWWQWAQVLRDLRRRQRTDKSKALVVVCGVEMRNRKAWPRGGRSTERDRQTDSHFNRGQDNIVSGENKTDFFFFKKKYGFAFFCGFEYLEERCEQLLLGLLAKRLTK